MPDRQLTWLKWFGSVATIVGVALTAFDITPANKVVGMIGSVGWCWAGWRMKEPALYLLNAGFMGLYILGWLLR